MIFKRNPQTEKVRALIAVGRSGRAVIISTDSPCLDRDVDAIGDDADDIGIEVTTSPGVYLWEGTATERWSGLPGEEEFETEYEGRARDIEPCELESLEAMEPPEPPEPSAA